MSNMPACSSAVRPQTHKLGVTPQRKALLSRPSRPDSLSARGQSGTALKWKTEALYGTINICVRLFSCRSYRSPSPKLSDGSVIFSKRVSTIKMNVLRSKTTHFASSLNSAQRWTWNNSTPLWLSAQQLLRRGSDLAGLLGCFRSHLIPFSWRFIT